MRADVRTASAKRVIVQKMNAVANVSAAKRRKKKSKSLKAVAKKIVAEEIVSRKKYTSGLNFDNLEKFSHGCGISNHQ